MKLCSKELCKTELNAQDELNSNTEVTQFVIEISGVKKRSGITVCGQATLCLNSGNSIFRPTLRARLAQRH